MLKSTASTVSTRGIYWQMHPVEESVECSRGISTGIFPPTSTVAHWEKAAKGQTH